jgi:hypothetical protein
VPARVAVAVESSRRSDRPPDRHIRADGIASQAARPCCQRATSPSGMTRPTRRHRSSAVPGRCAQHARGRKCRPASLSGGSIVGTLVVASRTTSSASSAGHLPVDYPFLVLCPEQSRPYGPDAAVDASQPCQGVPTKNAIGPSARRSRPT